MSTYLYSVKGGLHQNNLDLAMPFKGQEPQSAKVLIVIDYV